MKEFKLNDVVYLPCSTFSMKQCSKCGGYGCKFCYDMGERMEATFSVGEYKVFGKKTRQEESVAALYNRKEVEYLLVDKHSASRKVVVINGEYGNNPDNIMFELEVECGIFCRSLNLINGKVATL